MSRLYLQLLPCAGGLRQSIVDVYYMTSGFFFCGLRVLAPPQGQPAGMTVQGYTHGGTAHGQGRAVRFLCFVDW
jgi:hypothetical protein